MSSSRYYYYYYNLLLLLQSTTTTTTTTTTTCRRASGARRGGLEDAIRPYLAELPAVVLVDVSSVQRLAIGLAMDVVGQWPSSASQLVSKRLVGTRLELG